MIPKGVVRKKYLYKNQVEIRLTNAQSHEEFGENSEYTSRD